MNGESGGEKGSISEGSISGGGSNKRELGERVTGSISRESGDEGTGLEGKDEIE